MGYSHEPFLLFIQEKKAIGTEENGDQILADLWPN